MEEASVEDGKNKEELYCVNCTSKILQSQVGTYHKCKMELPKMTQKRNAVQIETDLIVESFQVKDPFHFENVGFSKPVNSIGMKYLTCADCELGPIGWQEIPTGPCSVAVGRVLQGNTSSTNNEIKNS